MTEIDMDSGLPVRTCANCACHHIQQNQINPLESQSFCHRDPPSAAKMRGERPQMINGQPRMMKDGKTPIMQTVEEVIYLYKPTMPNLVCFDGWRPLGTLPGERSGSELSEGIMAAMRRLYTDMVQNNDAAELEALRRSDVDAEGKNN